MLDHPSPWDQGKRFSIFVGVRESQCRNDRGCDRVPTFKY
jgi:hypothetical protein